MTNTTDPVRALAGVAEQLRRAGASLPAPEVKGTPESGVTTGLSIALALVEAALASAPPSAPVGVEGRDQVIRQFNYILWMDGDGGCEPPAEWQAGYQADLAQQPEALPKTREELIPIAREILRQLGVVDDLLDAAIRRCSAQHPEAPAQAWMDPSTLDVIHADRKKAWAEDYGAGGKSKSAAYTVPLYTTPPAAPPSVPVGVAGDAVDVDAIQHILKHALRDGVHGGYTAGFIENQIAALAQQPAAPSGEELDARALGRFAQDEWMDTHKDYPSWGFLTQMERDAWLAVGERIKRVIATHHQVVRRDAAPQQPEAPAQGAVAEIVRSNGDSAPSGYPVLKWADNLYSILHKHPIGTKLYTAPQPAIPEGAWRLLYKGEAIQRGDEVLADNCVEWGPLCGWERGMAYDPAAFVPVRRRIKEPDHG